MDKGLKEKGIELIREEIKNTNKLLESTIKLLNVFITILMVGLVILAPLLYSSGVYYPATIIVIAYIPVLIFCLKSRNKSKIRFEKHIEKCETKLKELEDEL